MAATPLTNGMSYCIGQKAPTSNDVVNRAVPATQVSS